MNPVLFVHACAATISLLAGYLSIVFRKGSSLHRISGSIFFGAMLVMCTTAAWVATFMRPNPGNVMGSFLTLYLVLTGWQASKRRDNAVSAFDWFALALGISVAVAGWRWGFQAASSPTGQLSKYPAGLFFTFASIMLLFAASDIRMIVRGGVAGSRRIARHLWRISMSLLMTTISLFPGNGRFFPLWLRQTNLLYIPHVLLIGAMVFWMYRVRARKRVRHDKVIEETTEATALRAA